MTGSRALHGRSEAIQSPVERPHFAGLEALRALAASMVVVHHVASVANRGPEPFLTLAAVMDAGVSVFFVLSGFLIFRPFATHLLDGSPRQATLAFWWRRVLRIVPAYWLALSVLWAVGDLQLGDAWWKHYLLLQPFDRFTALGGIVPAWSLSTEISFYLLVPPLSAALGFAVGRLAPPSSPHRAWWLGAGIVVVSLVGPLSRATASDWAGADAPLAFQWLPTNLDLFGAGMLLAVVSAWTAIGGSRVGEIVHRAGRPAWAWWVTAAVVFALYAYGVGGVDLATGYTGWFWQRRQFTFTAFALLLLVPAVFGDQQHGLLRTVWAWQPVAWVGTVSYGLYLWHVGLLERIADGFDLTDPLVLTVATFAAGLTAAALSWYLLERPLQRFKGVLDSVARRGPDRA